MKLIKRQGKWYVKYKTAAGSWDRFTTGLDATADEKEAEKVGARLLKERIGGTAPVRERALGSILNTAEALEYVYVGRWKDTASDIQLKYVVRAMEREIGHWLLADMAGTEGYKRIKTYRDALLKDGKAKATANRRMSVLKVTLREMVKEGHLSSMPVFPETLAEENVTERFLSVEEEERVLEYLKKKALADTYGTPGTGEWVYMRALVIVLLDTGARLSEALAVRKVDNREVIFQGSTTKSGKPRRVPLTTRAQVALDIMLKHPVHCTLTNGPDWCGHRWGFVRRDCGIPEVNLHLLRHTFACRLLERGVDLYVVSKLLGHSSIKVTERYAFLARTSNLFEDAIERLRPAQTGPSHKCVADSGPKPLAHEDAIELPKEDWRARRDSN